MCQSLYPNFCGNVDSSDFSDFNGDFDVVWDRKQIDVAKKDLDDLIRSVFQEINIRIGTGMVDKVIQSAFLLDKGPGIPEFVCKNLL